MNHHVILINVYPIKGHIKLAKFPSFRPPWKLVNCTIHHPPYRPNTGKEFGVNLAGGNLYQVVDTHLGVPGNLKGQATQNWLRISYRKDEERNMKT